MKSVGQTTNVPTFSKIANELDRLGYQPVPIRPGTKAPDVAGWQQYKKPVHWIKSRRLGSHWTGILTANTPAIDLDVRDDDLVNKLITLADVTLGKAPIRIGSPPKAILLYRCKQSFKKRFSPWFVLPKDNWRDPTYRAHRLEILCDRQQFVAYGIHPGTGSSYKWNGRSEPLKKSASKLPEISEETADIFLEEAWNIARDYGALQVRQYRRQWCSVEKTQDELEKSTKTIAWWKSLTIDQLIQPLGLKKQGKSWVMRCPVHCGEHTNSLNIIEGDDGRLLAHCFAECSFEDISNAICDILDEYLDDVN